MIFEPDVILPAQLRGNLRARLMPEQSLCAAILADAIHCFNKYQHARTKLARRLFLDAEEWLSADEPQWPFSFVRICEVLGLDPSYVRSGLLNPDGEQCNDVAPERHAQPEESPWRPSQSIKATFFSAQDG